MGFLFTKREIMGLIAAVLLFPWVFGGVALYFEFVLSYLGL